MSKPNKIGNKCLKEAIKYSEAVTKVTNSGMLPLLIDAFEWNDQTRFNAVLDLIPDLDEDIKQKMKDHALENSSVTFTWF
jgi:hypothetical protein